MPTAEERAQGKGGKGVSGSGRSATARNSSRLDSAFNSTPDMARGWDEVDPRFMQWVVVAASKLGGAVTFGQSRDGQALQVAVMLDGDRKSFWIAPGESIADKLTRIAEVLEALA